MTLVDHPVVLLHAVVAKGFRGEGDAHGLLLAWIQPQLVVSLQLLVRPGQLVADGRHVHLRNHSGAHLGHVLYREAHFVAMRLGLEGSVAILEGTVAQAVTEGEHGLNAEVLHCAISQKHAFLVFCVGIRVPVAAALLDGGHNGVIVPGRGILVFGAPEGERRASGGRRCAGDDGGKRLSAFLPSVPCQQQALDFAYPGSDYIGSSTKSEIE